MSSKWSPHCTAGEADAGGDAATVQMTTCGRPERTENVYFGGYSNFYPSIGAPSPAILFGNGGYAAYVDQQYLLQPDPRPANGGKLNWHYTQNYNMQPHYGQQYPDRHPPGTNEANGRDFRRNRTLQCADSPQRRRVQSYPTG